MKKYEIDYNFGTNSVGTVVLIIYVGNPDGDLIKRSNSDLELLYEWPAGWAPDGDIYPVVAFVEKGKAGNKQPLEFVTSMEPDNTKYGNIFVMQDDHNGKIKRKRRTQVKVTSGGGF